VISHFYDSSSFVKLFVKEDGTTEMLHLYAAADRRFVSRLAFVETQSAIVRLEREGQLSAADADKAGILLTQEANRVEVIELTTEIASLARALLRKHPLRSLDAIQLASALNAMPVTAFIGSDIRLLAAAGIEGLNIVDPAKV